MSLHIGTRASSQVSKRIICSTCQAQRDNRLYSTTVRKHGNAKQTYASAANIDISPPPPPPPPPKSSSFLTTAILAGAAFGVGYAVSKYLDDFAGLEEATATNAQTLPIAPKQSSGRPCSRKNFLHRINDEQTGRYRSLESVEVDLELGGRPTRMVLVTGPRGCGKSELIYAALKKHNVDTVSISSSQVAATHGGITSMRTFVETMEEKLQDLIREEAKTPGKHVVGCDQRVMLADRLQVCLNSLLSYSTRQTEPEKDKRPPGLALHIAGLEDIYLSEYNSEEDKAAINLLLQWAVYVTSEAHTCQVIIESRDSLVADHLQLLQPKVRHHHKTIALWHGSNSDAVEFVRDRLTVKQAGEVRDDENDTSEGQRSVTQEEVGHIVSALGGHFTSLRDVTARVSSGVLPIELAVEEQLATARKALIAALTEESVNAVRLWDLLSALVKSPNGVVLLEDAEKTLQSKGVKNAKVELRALLHHNREFLFTYYDGIPTAVAAHIYVNELKRKEKALEEKKARETASSSFWGTSQVEEAEVGEEAMRVLSGYYAASSPVYLTVVEETMRDSKVQQSMWEKKKKLGVS